MLTVPLVLTFLVIGLCIYAATRGPEPGKPAGWPLWAAVFVLSVIELLRQLPHGQ